MTRSVFEHLPGLTCSSTAGVVVSCFIQILTSFVVSCCVYRQGLPPPFPHLQGLPDLGLCFAVAMCVCANALHLWSPQFHPTLPGLDPRCVHKAEKHLSLSYFFLFFMIFCLSFLSCAGGMQAGEAGEPCTSTRAHCQEIYLCQLIALQPASLSCFLFY